jgi:predicted HTH domain antitoxin
MNVTLQMEFPESIFAVLRQDKEELVKMVKLCAAVKLYELRSLSQKKASELAGMSRGEFILALKDFEVRPYQYGAQEILSEIHKLGLSWYSEKVENC